MAVEPTNGKCYCCIDPRTGVIVIAVLHISGALGVLYLIGALAVEGHIMLWGPIIELLVGFMAGATLLYGAIKYNTAAIIIHIVLAVIEIIIFLVVSIFLHYLHLHLRYLHWRITSSFWALRLLLLASLYTLLFVYTNFTKKSNPGPLFQLESYEINI